jgi:hypothetical protein
MVPIKDFYQSANFGQTFSLAGFSAKFSVPVCECPCVRVFCANRRRCMKITIAGARIQHIKDRSVADSRDCTATIVCKWSRAAMLR